MELYNVFLYINFGAENAKTVDKVISRDRDNDEVFREKQFLVAKAITVSRGPPVSFMSSLITASLPQFNYEVFLIPFPVLGLPPSMFTEFPARRLSVRLRLHFFNPL